MAVNSEDVRKILNDALKDLDRLERQKSNTEKKLSQICRDIEVKEALRDSLQPLFENEQSERASENQQTASPGRKPDPNSAASLALKTLAESGNPMNLDSILEELGEDPYDSKLRTKYRAALNGMDGRKVTKIGEGELAEYTLIAGSSAEAEED